MAGETYSAVKTAARVGLSVHRFRKVWDGYVKRRAFPAPITSPPEGNYQWDAAAVEAWIKARSAALGAAEVTPRRTHGRARWDEDQPPPPRPGSPGARRLAQEAAELQSFMERI